MKQENDMDNNGKKTGWKEILTLILGIISLIPSSYFCAVGSIILGILSKEENNGKIHILVRIGWVSSIISIIIYFVLECLFLIYILTK